MARKRRANPNTVLATITADSPFATQPVTKFTREIDPEGTRTLGLITKPDKIDGQVESQKYYIDMAQNQNVKLHLGWHVLRNRSHDERADSEEEHDAREAAFFQSSVWSELKPSQLGTEALRTRLREILWSQIRRGLPGVKADVQAGITDCRGKLKQLGLPRNSLREKHAYLHNIGSYLSKLVQAAIDGVYANEFFESMPGRSDQMDRRLRAHVQHILAMYSDKMTLDGHALEIVEDGVNPERHKPSTFRLRAEYLREVTVLMAECKGRELPGTFNPLVVSDLFNRQSKPWKAITNNLIEQIHTAAMTTFNKMISEYCDANTHRRLMNDHVQPSLHGLRKQLQDKVDELLSPHMRIHPITYNEDLINGVQKIQTTRHYRNFDRLSNQVCHYSAETADATQVVCKQTALGTIFKHIRTGLEPDVQGYAACLAADVAAAYYQVSFGHDSCARM